MPPDPLGSVTNREVGEEGGEGGGGGGVGFLNSARLIQIRSSSSVTFQSSLFKRLVSL